MDWSTIVTGIVGVAGMAFTFLGIWWQKRQQIQELKLRRSHEVQDMLRQERKAVYAEFLKLSNEINRIDKEIVVSVEFRYRGGWAITDSDIQNFDSQLRRREELFVELQTVEADLLLVADQQVQASADRFMTELRKTERWVKDYTMFTQAELPDRLKRLASRATIIAREAEAKSGLASEMRADLGRVEEHLPQRVSKGEHGGISTVPPPQRTVPSQTEKNPGPE